MANRLGDLNKNTKDLAGNLGFLSNTFKSWLGFLGVREIASMSDQFQNLGNRLKIIVGDGQAATDAMKTIAQVADETKQSITDVGNVFARFGTVLKSYGASTDSITALTKDLINTFRIAGATGQETASTMVQLSQSFASGELRGQELRSVMEQNAVLATLLRQKFGKDLFEDAKKGMIQVTDVLKILRDNSKTFTEQAAKLAPTFENSITKLFNAITIGVGKFNDLSGASWGFAKSIDFIIDKAGLLAITLGTVLFPTILTGIIKITEASLLFATKNPLGLAFAAIGVALLFLFEDFNDFQQALVKMNLAFKEFKLSIDLQFSKGLEKIGLLTKASITDLNNQMGAIRDLRKELKELQKEQKANADAKSLLSDPDAMRKAYDDLIKQIEAQNKGTGSLKDLQKELAALNQMYLDGKITLESYSETLRRINLDQVIAKMKEGKSDVLDFNKQMRELNIEKANADLRDMNITLEEFNGIIEGIKTKELDDKLKSGKINLIDYNKELVKIQSTLSNSSIIAGTASYIESIGTLSSNVADGIKNTFSALEDSFVNFIKTGKMNFKDFAQGILDDLNRIIVRASIVRPLADAILSGFGSGVATSGGMGGGGSIGQQPMAYVAKGAAFDSVNKFAMGGVFDSPTMFKYGGGFKTGVMGEAGPEAVMPLSRGSDGKLGVVAQTAPVVVNIINQSGADVNQSESTGPNGEKQIDIIIKNTVKAGIQNGTFDRNFNSAYGLTRKGV